MNVPHSIDAIKVSLDFGTESLPVGRLAKGERHIYFEYDTPFLKRGLNISPFHLPLEPGLFSFDYGLFEGLPGIFNDSLPDGWGRLLFDRFVRSQGYLPRQFSSLDRLTHVGANGLGALVYEPDYGAKNTSNDIDLDSLAVQVQQVLQGESDGVLQELQTLNGSSAGARPKAIIGVNSSYDSIIHGVYDLPDGYTPWMVKFPNGQDGMDSGAIEYVYALMAKEAGIVMPDVHLFPAQQGAGYFAIKRFDREDKKRYHMHTACGLLHSDFRIPSLDYEDLIALTGHLTRDVREIEKMYRLAVFNVLSHNRDDHSKNFTFLMDSYGQWALSPAYDLTFSSGPGGEQSTMVMGEGKSPKVENLLALAQESNIDVRKAKEIIDKTKTSLSQWSNLAKHYGISAVEIQRVQSRLDNVDF